ncbi:non-canonical poly(A) RNA polymerase PAPD5 [Chlorella sorokiniana]|uniref:polynucleotide adenylyltransferase n=1 Tax=Chlorella sorokiniana TaxID=3076 RepID=A0A2P6U0A2_CHLSO|nr:non-canonical poly(A) RNA polymerase PAPD5 [Chlorella sorokiniana]|eukprot:PRW59743.1 non-canonical poly(A) RNA polymerase PAPD5 [Chlorella sorokiniana]
MAAPAEKLVPVHDEPGAVQFKYTTSYVALGGGLALGGSGGGGNGAAAAAAEPLSVWEERPQAAEPAKQAPPLEDLEDFISLEEAAPVAQAGTAARGADAAAGGGVGNLLDDYVLLGILEDPAAAATKKAAAAARSQRPELLQRVPWMAALKGIRSPLLRVHQEIVEFCRYLAPSPAEAAARQAAIDRIEDVVTSIWPKACRIEDVVTSIWPKARVEVFGSFATGLYLPTSDVDAVIMGSGCSDVPQGLKALANALARRNMAKNMQVIAKAKVPIVKFEDAETGYAFDVSFDVANGPEAAENVRALMDSLPPMRPLVMVLKVFLQQRELNEVYSGGLGSYALLVMVAAFLQLHPSRVQAGSGYGYKGKRGAAEEIEGSLGVLLVDFLRLYGRALNNQEVGVSCRRGGSYFSKRQKGFFQPDRPFLYAVEDPNDPSNDLGRNSYNISRVRMAFDWAYCQLVAPSEPDVSLLQRIIRLDPVLFERSPPPYDDASPPPPPSGVGKKKRKDKERRRSEEAGGSPSAQQQQQQQQGAESGGGPRQKKKKWRHRERSMSDGDEEEGEAAAAPSGGSGGRWELDESGEDSEDERRHKKRHKHHKHSHHHSRHGKHSGGEAAQRRRQSDPGGGGGGQHTYFFD